MIGLVCGYSIFIPWCYPVLTPSQESVRGMFTFAFDNYMTYAYPMDELDPIHCTGKPCV